MNQHNPFNRRLLTEIPRPALIGALLLALLACGSGPMEHDASTRDASATSDAAGQGLGRDAGTEPDADIEPDAGEPCEPAATRTVECGFCGSDSQRCTADGLWESIAGCLAQGECAAGTVEMDDLGMCAVRTRICDGECAWRAWEEAQPPGDCEPGSSRSLTEGCGMGETRTQACSVDCAWVDDQACSDPCVGTRRTVPWHAEEICIPAGPFLRGTNRPGFFGPQAEVYLSAFYLDRYPVTNSRYRECVMAGACAAPGFEGGEDYEDAAKANFPVHTLYWQDAVDFCTWDGGRRLPTEAEWEKAARGPAPNAQDYPWGDTLCGVIPLATCGWTVPEEQRRNAHDPVDAYPAAASHYGVELMVGGVKQFCSDWLDLNYYSDPTSLSDPQGPATGRSRIARGSLRDDRASPPFVWQRNSVSLDFPGSTTGIRCARDGA